MTAKEILKRYWGHDSFRPYQEEIIDAALAKRDTLAILPTGGGKSVCFQIPALSLPGICIVITPLIALMKDQVMQLHQKGISALAIYSGMSRYEIDIVLDRCIYDEIKFLYVSPERLKTELFKERASKMNINLIAVDEAHCISQWGYDFRPSYLEVADFRKLIPQVPVIALTASATPDVIEDIQQKLKFKSENVLQNSFARPSISYSCFEEENKDKRVNDILCNVSGSSIIYVGSRKRAQQLCKSLQLSGNIVGYYHAGLSHQKRLEVQSSWITNKTRVMVATNAFGMGIDKPDVRTVIHYDVPGSMEAYYQEAGRAGRDQNKSYAVLLYEKGEFTRMREKIEENYPLLSYIKQIYQSLANFFQLALGSNEMASYSFDIEAFSKNYGLKVKEVYPAIAILQRQNFIVLSENFYEASKIYFVLNGEDLYRYQIAHPIHDGLIKVLLRMYGGESFTLPTEISENKISLAMGLSLSDIKGALRSLQTHGVLRYEPQKESPHLTFLTPRQDAEKLSINTALLNERKSLDLMKVLTMEHYCLSSAICRSIEILKYFGENNAKPCGKCDVCRLKVTAPERTYNTTAMAIQKVLLDAAMSSTEICRHLPDMQESVIINTLRDMLDAHTIDHNAQGLFTIKR